MNEAGGLVSDRFVGAGHKIQVVDGIIFDRLVDDVQIQVAVEIKIEKISTLAGAEVGQSVRRGAFGERAIFIIDKKEVDSVGRWFQPGTAYVEVWKSIRVDVCHGDAGLQSGGCGHAGFGCDVLESEAASIPIEAAFALAGREVEVLQPVQVKIQYPYPAAVINVWI